MAELAASLILRPQALTQFFRASASSQLFLHASAKMFRAVDNP
jgi:hypothetical protein